MTRKYRQGMESGDADTNQRDTNPNISRRDWLKLGVIGVGVIGLASAGRKYMEYNPQTIEKWCNEIMRRNNDPDAVENIHERIARYEKELEELVEDAQPISTFEELDGVRRNLRGNYKLVNDIYCPQGHNWEPIGDYRNPFFGTFNGQGYTIYDLRAEWPERDFVGMFGVVENVNGLGAVANLKLEGVKIKGRSHIGKLAGFNSKGFVQNNKIKGEVKGINYIGGIIGSNYFGILNKCLDTGNVKGKNRIGGLIGINTGYIVNSLSDSDVDGKESGTLIGWNHVYITSSDDYSPHIINSTGTIGLDTSPNKE